MCNFGDNYFTSDDLYKSYHNMDSFFNKVTYLGYFIYGQTIGNDKMGGGNPTFCLHW